MVLGVGVDGLAAHGHRCTTQARGTGAWDQSDAAVDQLPVRHHQGPAAGLHNLVGNDGMLRIGQHLGFTEEARFRGGAADGVPHDSVVMGVLRREWDREQPKPV